MVIKEHFTGGNTHSKLIRVNHTVSFNCKDSHNNKVSGNLRLSYPRNPPTPRKGSGLELGLGLGPREISKGIFF